MKKAVPKNNLPLPFLLSLGFGLITFFIFQKIHSIRPPVFYPWYLLLVNILPSLLTLGLLLYGFTAASDKKPYRVWLLVFSSWDMFGSTWNTVDLWNLTQAQAFEVFKGWSNLHALFEGDLLNLGSFVLNFLIGWSFLKKKPYGFDYPKVDPLQDVFMKFIGVLWIVDGVYQTGLHLMVLMYKVMRMF
jgi:hypothetical protein